MATVNSWVDLAGRSYIDVVIAGGAAVSDIIALGNRSIVGLQFDAAFAGTAVTLQSGGTDATLANYYYDTGALSITVAASRFVGIDVSKTFGMTGFAKLTSGTSQGGGTPTTVRVYAVNW
jgi:hypothetical protein